jgi:hypothetical protein
MPNANDETECRKAFGIGHSAFDFGIRHSPFAIDQMTKKPGPPTENRAFRLIEKAR